MNNIYIGFDTSNYGQQLAYDVCKRSIQKYNKNIKIYQLNKKKLEKKIKFNRKDNSGSTEFTYTRFLVPYLNNYEGWALFCDSDFLWFCDPVEIFDKYADNKYAVCCVKHEYTNCHGREKMDGQKQEYYPRKNWSSLMLFNCSHPSIKNLSLNNVNKKSPKYLHRMEWCKDEEVGEIDKSYNYLVGYYDDNNYKALHYTDGGPWHPGYEDVEYGNLWLEYLTYIENIKMKYKKKSNILYVTTFNKRLYEEYAYRFLDTFNATGDLLIYSEDNIEFIKNKCKKKLKSNYTVINSNKAIPELDKFVKRNQERNKQDVKKNNGWGNLYWNGIKFCYKVFAVTHAGLNFQNYENIIWIDADTIFKKPLSKNKLNKFIDKDAMMNFFGRKKQYSECGFLVFNLKHNKCKDYFKEMKRMYTSNDIYTLKEWHDSYVWDHVRVKFEKNHNVKTHSISGFKYNDHVLLFTNLYMYFDHLKGTTRKKQGYSCTLKHYKKIYGKAKK